MILKVFDVFIFNNELDLLELRLTYLYPHVDFFIILESSQTFSGHPKDYNYLINKVRYERFSDKIKYYTFAEDISGYQDLESVLLRHGSLGEKILLELDEILDDDKEKRYPHWVRDAYQREICRLALDESASLKDLVIFGDLDEIPSLAAVNKYKELNLKSPLSKVYFPLMLDFEFSVNRLRGFEWAGSCFSSYKTLENIGLNRVRSIAVYRRANKLVQLDTEEGGYHFSSVGSISDLKSKIMAYGHQEFNIFPVIFFLKYNLNSGRDIFYKKKVSAKFIDLEDNLKFDKKMLSILRSRFSHLWFSPRPSIWSNSMSFLGFQLNLIWKIPRKIKNLYENN